LDLNLDTLKREILDYLDSAGMAVFYSNPGGLEGLPMVLWDTTRFPDYQVFLQVAKRLGLQLVVFASRQLDGDDLDELGLQLDALEIPRDMKRDLEKRLRDLRSYVGVTCSLELAFDYQSRLYVYEVQPDWYEDFLAAEDEIVSAATEDDDEPDSYPGYFSKN
jgi:hypothetical protein